MSEEIYQNGILVDEDEDEDDGDAYEPSYFSHNSDEYIRSATLGDYSPSSPWNAPGMSESDFI